MAHTQFPGFCDTYRRQRPGLLQQHLVLEDPPDGLRRRAGRHLHRLRACGPTSGPRSRELTDLREPVDEPGHRPGSSRAARIGQLRGTDRIVTTLAPGTALARRPRVARRRDASPRRLLSSTRARPSPSSSRRPSAGWASSTSDRWRCSWCRRSSRSTRATSQVVREFSLKNFETILNEPVYRTITLRTVSMAIAVTITCAVIAFPVAFYMARVASPRTRRLLVMATLLPLWSSYVVKVFAWRVILQPNGPLDWVGQQVGHGCAAPRPLRCLRAGSCSRICGCRT